MKKETFRLRERVKLVNIDDAEKALDNLDNIKRQKEFVLDDSRERRQSHGR